MAVHVKQVMVHRIVPQINMFKRIAEVAELVYAHVSEACGETLVGSSPTFGILLMGLLQNAHLRRYLLVRLCDVRRGRLRAHLVKPCIWTFCNSPFID